MMCPGPLWTRSWCFYLLALFSVVPGTNVPSRTFGHFCRHLVYGKLPHATFTVFWSILSGTWNVDFAYMSIVFRHFSPLSLPNTRQNAWSATRKLHKHFQIPHSSHLSERWNPTECNNSRDSLHFRRAKTRLLGANSVFCVRQPAIAYNCNIMLMHQ